MAVVPTASPGPTGCLLHGTAPTSGCLDSAGDLGRLLAAITASSKGVPVCHLLSGDIDKWSDEKNAWGTAQNG